VEVINRLLKSIVLKHLPEEYEDTRHWGKQKRVIDGLKVSLDGLRIKTKRRWKHVDHGTWRRYRIAPIDPNENFRLSIEKVYAAKSGRTAIDLVGRAPLASHARLSEHRLDVQLYSFSIDATADVQLRMTIEFGVQVESEAFPPAVVLDVEVTGAQLDLIDFRIQKVSKLKGPLVKQLSGALRQVIERKLDDRRDKLVAKVNGQIARRSDQLRFSLSDFASSQWNKMKATLDPSAANR